MFYYTYKITEKETGNFYIGARGSKKDPLLDLGIKYFSSSENLKSMILERGEESFIFEIIKDSYKSWKEAYDDEQLMIFNDWENPLNINKACYYMKKDFGIISEDSKKIISKKSLEMWKDEEMSSKIIEKQKESWTDERREKYREMTKSKWTVERREKHSEKLKGRIGSKKLKGIKKPEGFGQKISEKLKGVKKSEETKRKISESKTGKIYPHLRKLSSENIKEIQEKINEGRKISDLSKEYNVSQIMIYRIRNGSLNP